MKKTTETFQFLCRHVILCVTCIFLYIPQCCGQFNISVQAESFFDYCNDIKYFIELEKTVSATQDDLILEIQFSDPVNYLSNSLDLDPILINSRFLQFSVDDISDCAIRNGSLTIIPECYDIFTNIMAVFSLKSAQDCIAETTQDIVIKNPFMDVQFSDYVYDPEFETLTKSLTLFNAGSIGIQSFYLLPNIDQNFATLTSTSLGSIRRDTLFIDEGDLNSAILSTGSEIIIELVFTINRCDIRTIDYELGYTCQSSNCHTAQQFVDENDIYQNNVEGFLNDNQSGFNQTLDYGICQPLANTVVFKNSVLQQRTSIGDIYNIAYVVEIEDRFFRRFNECINVTGSIAGQALTVVRNNDTQHVLFFDNITSDPDGRGGIDDLDGDGQFDDIPLGDSTSFEIELQLNDICFETYENLEGAFTLYPSYSNYCQLMSNSRSSANREFPFLSNHFNVSFPHISAFNRDQSNKRFLDNGENITTTIRIRPSVTVSEQCNSNELLLTIDIPSKLEYDNSQDIIYYDNNDTIILIPNIVNDTLLELAFTELDSSQTFIDISFNAICDIDADTNYDNAIPVCDQCVEYSTESLRAELSKTCNLNCAAMALSRQGRSAPFYTRCAEVPALEEPFVIDEVDIFNLSAGYIDKERTTRRDPYANPSSINNKYFFDGDTMLIQVPFSFNCIQELQNYTIIINENQLSLYKFDILESNIIIFDKNTNGELGRCSASLFLSQTDSQISFSFDQSSFDLPCIDPNQDHILEVLIKFTRECMLDQNCSLAESGNLQTLTDITLMSGCSKRIFYDRDTVFINEVFKEEFFNPIENVFLLQSEIYDSMSLSFTLYPNVFNPKMGEPEFKDFPILKEINYIVPQGYEIISDLKLIETDFFIIELENFQFGNETAGDTLLSMPATIVQNTDGTTEYQFKNIPTDYSNGSILKPVVGGLILKSVCQPSEVIQEITVSGIIEYVNYANDTRERIEFLFSEKANISFLPEQFDALDDFQILESTRAAEWTYNKSSSFFLNSFNVGTNALSPEQQYSFKYQSGGMIVDSISTYANEGFGFMDNNKISAINNYVGDSIIELTLLPEIIVLGNGDTLINDVDLSFIKIHTSQHACGFDTLFFELGRKAQFTQDSCDNNLYSDFFVSYSPPGFPQVKFSKIPVEIKTFETNQFEFTLSNIAQGTLVENTIYIDDVPEGNYQLMLKDENELTNISEAIEWQNDQLIIDLSIIDLQQISGLSGFNISSIDFILTADDLCIDNTFLNMSLFAQSLSYCGDTIISPLAKTDRLPFISEEDIMFDMMVSSFINRACLDTAHINIQIKTDQIQQVITPRIELIVPDDLFLHSNTVKLNGQIIPDPVTKPNEEGFSKVFIIQEGLPVLLSDSISIDISFDGECIDLCREDVISVFMLSELETSCASNSTSVQAVTRAYRANKKVNWKADLVFENIESSLVDSRGDNVTLEVIGEIFITNQIQQNEAIILYSYSDDNQNEQFDIGELIFDNIIIDADRIQANSAEIKDSIEIPSQYLCSLALTTATEENCVCEPSSVSIKQNGDVTFERIIQNCSDIAFPIAFQYIETCNSNIMLNPRLLEDMDGIFSYVPDLGLATDTIRVFNDCTGCQITERVIILNSEPDLNIDVITTSDCTTSTSVTYNGSSTIPEQFDISWSSGQSSQQIENVEDGELIVTLLDQQACTYSDTIIIENINELEYNLETNSGSCTANIPGSALITITNDPTVTISWNDGSQNLSRTDLDAGDYRFTITNDNGCSQIDSFNLNPIGNLDFAISTTNANCDSLLSGQIEFGSQDMSLQYSIDGLSFSNQETIDNLSVGTYVVYAMNDVGCLDSLSAEIILDGNLDAGVNSFLNGMRQQELELNSDPIQQANLSWNWTSDDFSLSCNTCPSPTAFVEGEGTVELILSNGICTSNEIIDIRIPLSNDIYTPNVFHPNSIAGNNLFFIYPSSSFDEIDLAIFDRWGNQVFDLRNVPIEDTTVSGWDGTFNGKESIEGVYVFKAVVRRFVDDTELELLGDFMLLR